MTITNNCPCQVQENQPAAYQDCCGPFHAGVKPSTALTLMRARYAAFALNLVDFIWATQTPDLHQGLDRQVFEAQLRQQQWLYLKIENSQLGAKKDTSGRVTFIARHRQGERIYAMREDSSFSRTDDQWIYTGGEQLAVAKHPANARCWCRSGLKYKRCHKPLEA